MKIDATIETILLDDEHEALEGLARMVAKIPNLVIKGQYKTISEFREALDSLSPDLIITDIQFDGGDITRESKVEVDGEASTIFEALADKGTWPQVIFITAYEEQYGQEARSIDGCVAVLQKPPLQEELEEKVRIAVNNIFDKKWGNMPEKYHVIPKNSLQRESYIRFSTNMLAYVAMDGNLATFTMADGRVERVSGASLTKINRKLQGFLRISKTHLVNPLHIRDICVVEKACTVLVNGQTHCLNFQRDGQELFRKFIDRYNLVDR